MKIEYDPKHDIMNIEFISGVEIEESLELEGGIIIDYTREKKIASLEILDVGKRIQPNALEELNLVIMKGEAKA